MKKIIYLVIFILFSISIFALNNSIYKINQINLNEGSKSQVYNNQYNGIINLGKVYKSVENNSNYKLTLGLFPFKNIKFTTLVLTFPNRGQILNYGEIDLTYNCPGSYPNSLVYGSKDNPYNYVLLKNDSNETYRWFLEETGKTYYWKVICYNDESTIQSSSYFILNLRTTGIGGGKGIIEEVFVKEITDKTPLFNQSVYNDSNCEFSKKSLRVDILFTRNIDLINDSAEFIKNPLDCENIYLKQDRVTLNNCNCNNILKDNIVDIEVIENGEVHKAEINFKFTKNLGFIFLIIMIIIISLSLIIYYIIKKNEVF